MNMEWLIANETLVGSPDRAERDIFGDVFLGRHRVQIPHERRNIFFDQLSVARASAMHLVLFGNIESPWPHWGQR